MKEEMAWFLVLDTPEHVDSEKLNLYQLFSKRDFNL
jgi:hypothetical protein